MLNKNTSDNLGIWLAKMAMAWLALALPTSQAADFVTFTNQTGLGPKSLVSADFNSDGRLDLVCANSSANNLTVFTNSGSGQMVSNSAPVVGASPVGLAVIDANMDGKPDVVSLNSAGASMTILTNNGFGLLVSNATYFSGSFPVFVAAGDLNGDGWPDLVCASSGNNSILIYTNQPGGIFVSNVTVAAGGKPFAVAITDVNNDGLPDLAIANNNLGDDTVVILTNSPGLIFGSNATISLGVGADPTSIAAAPLNADNSPDLVVANLGAGNIMFLTNSGTGSFNISATLNTPGNPYSLSLADMDNNGSMDVSIADFADFPNPGNIFVLTNNGAGIFGSNSLVMVGQQPYSVVTGDFNDDGWPDPACVNYLPNSLNVLLQVGLLPTLSVTQTVTNIMVSWALPLGNGFVLQTNPALTGGAWNTAGLPISTNGLTGSVSLVPATSNLFFRLKK